MLYVLLVVNLYPWCQSIACYCVSFICILNHIYGCHNTVMDVASALVVDAISKLVVYLTHVLIA